MKLLRILPLLLVASLTACSNEIYYEDTTYLFHTHVSYKIKGYRGYTGLKTEGEAVNALKEVDAYTDAYQKRDIVGIYDLNHTNEKIEISKDLYRLLAFCQDVQQKAKYFNPLIGSLSNKWKEALANKQVLSDEVIQEELAKINASSLILDNTNSVGKYYAQRVGDALIDLGAIAKGYALDRAEDVLSVYSTTDDYLINAGSSSILLGTNTQKKKSVEEGNYVIKIKELSKDTYLHCNKSFISTSGISEQKTIIDNDTYSHIVNPLTGSAKPLYDAVIVINSTIGFMNGSLGDALSTSLMMSSLEEIKEVEEKENIEVIIIKDDDVLYKSDSVELH